MKPRLTYLPKIISVLIFLSGLLNITSVFWSSRMERFDAFNDFIPLEISQASRTFTLLAGIFLLFLANGLWQRRRRAWWLSLILLSLTFFAHFLKGLNYNEALLLLLPIILLLFARPFFVVQSDRLSPARMIVIIATTLLVTYLYTISGFYLLARHFSPAVSFNNINAEYQYQLLGIGNHALLPLGRQARWFDNSVWLVNLAALIFIVLAIFARVVAKWRLTPVQRSRLKYLVDNYGREASSYLSLMGDKQYFFTTDNSSILPYKVAGNVAVVLGSPLGPDDKITLAIKEFQEFAKVHGWSIAFINLNASERPYFEEAEFKFLKLGEETVVATKDFTLQGPKLSEVRHCVTRLEREGYKYHWYTLDQVPWRVINDLDKLHRSWLISRGEPAMGFSVDFYPLPIEPRAYLLAVYSARQELMAAFTFYPYDHNHKMGLDLMLRSERAVNGTVEAAWAEALRFFQEKKISTVSFGLAALSDIDETEDKGLWHQGLELLFKGLNKIYGYESLQNFKKKFMPVWQEKYLAVSSLSDLPKVAAAIIRVHVRSNSLWPTIFRKKEDKIT